MWPRRASRPKLTKLRVLGPDRVEGMSESGDGKTAPKRPANDFTSLQIEPEMLDRTH